MPAPPPHSQFRLLRERRFLPFFLTQFLGAFNDNVYKNSLVLVITFHAASLSTWSAATLVNVCAGLFILPFFLFSATAGQIADKFEKARLIRFVKLFEIAIMVVATVGFATSSLALLLSALFLMGLHSTLFGPVKYAILPQHLREDELVGGNGLVETGTFIAILLGTILAGLLAGNSTNLISMTVVALAIVGWLVSRAIPEAPPADPELRINWNPLTETWRNLAFTRGHRTVFLSILGVSWFWAYGALLLTQFPTLAKDVLGGGEHVVTLLLAVFSIGVAAGSLACERLSGHKVELGLVPFGSIGLTVIAVDLYFASPVTPSGIGLSAWAYVATHGAWRVLADLFLLGLFGGFYIVPLYALIQSRSEPHHRSRIIAGNNILNACFMVGAAIAAILFIEAGLSIPQLMLVAGLTNAAVALYIYKLVPEFLLRFLAWLLIHSVYRLRKQGLENVPEEGAAVIVCNHVSFADAVILMGACRRPMRFVMDHRIFRTPILSFVFRENRAIPIASAKEDAVMLERAFDEVAAALSAGELIAIFPEGSLTRTGELQPFRPGITRILERNPVPVVPMALSGLWGSAFSRRYQGIARLWPHRLFARVRLTVGKPLEASEAKPERLRVIVAALRGDSP